MKRELDKSDIATILAALRLFQEKYENDDEHAVYEDWEEHFTDDDGELIAPLGSDDINTLCEEINCGQVELRSERLPIVVVEGGCVQEVLNVKGYDVWDWDNFSDAPCEHWDGVGEGLRDNIRATFSALAIRQIQEHLGAEMAEEIELENKRKNADPFWMVEAR